MSEEITTPKDNTCNKISFETGGFDTGSLSLALLNHRGNLKRSSHVR